MKPTIPFVKFIRVSLAASAAVLMPGSGIAASLTWDGGGADDNWSTLENWSDGVSDPALAPVTGDTLVFSGNTRTTPNNDLIGLTLANVSGGATAAFTFDATADAFTITGNSVTSGNTGGNTVLVETSSTSDQVLANNINFANNQKDRYINFAVAGAGSIALNGNVAFGNDIIGLGRSISAASNAGTLILSGNNTGDGKNSQITSGGNVMRAMLWTPVDNARLVIGSNSALGNASTGSPTAGTNLLRGIISSKILSISTTGGDRDLSNYAFGISGARINYDGSSNLSIGSVINSGGNRDLWVTGDGKLTVTNALFLSNDTTGRNLYFNVTGSGGAEISGIVYDTFNNTGGTFGTMTTLGRLRKAGVGSLTLSGANVYAGSTSVEGGVLKLANAAALGANSTPATDYTSIQAGTLDLNGQTIAEKLWSDNAAATLANTSATAASVTTDIGLSNNLTINTTGDISATRIIAGTIRTVTKTGAGTLTTTGSNHNNLTTWDIQAGTVVFANTAGLASDRGTAINGGTLKLSGLNFNLINDGQAFTINSGSFDLNGKGEAVASIGGTGGTVTNSSATTATLYVGGGVAGTSSASFAGVIENGTGVLKVVKEGSGTQTLTGTNTYTGDTTVKAGILAVDGDAIANGNTLIIDGGQVDPSGATEVVDKLFFGAVQQASGTWGATGSGATHIDDTRFTGTGVVSVTSAPPAGYSTWASANAPGQTADQDHDGDGVENGVEYFMGLSGSAFTANPQPVSGSVTWPKDAAFSGTWAVQTSTDLSSWTPVSATDNGTSVSYTLPTGQSKVFVRLVVTPN